MPTLASTPASHPCPACHSRRPRAAFGTTSDNRRALVCRTCCDDLAALCRPDLPEADRERIQGRDHALPAGQLMTPADRSFLMYMRRQAQYGLARAISEASRERNRRVIERCTEKLAAEATP